MPILVQEPTRHDEVTSMRIKGSQLKVREQTDSIGDLAGMSRLTVPHLLLPYSLS